MENKTMNENTNLSTLLNLPQGQLAKAEDGQDYIPDNDCGVPRITAEIVRRILTANSEV